MGSAARVRAHGSGRRGPGASVVTSYGDRKNEKEKGECAAAHNVAGEKHGKAGEVEVWQIDDDVAVAGAEKNKDGEVYGASPPI